MLRPVRALPVLVALLCLLAPAVSDAASKRARAASLVAFDDCRELTAYARERLVQTGGGVGVPFRGDVLAPAVLRDPGVLPPPRRQPQPGEPVAMPMPAAAPTAMAEGGAAAGDVAFSETNTQEAGVDEPDLVKTDGRRLYVVEDATLRVFDVTGAAPRQIAKLALPGTDHQLLRRGPRLLVLATSVTARGAQIAPGVPVGAPAMPVLSELKVLLTEVDVSDPAAPKVARTMDLAGQLAGARQVGGTVRVVVASAPEPVVAEDPEALEDEAAGLPVSRFVPRTTIRSRITRRTFRRSVVPCGRVRHPRAFSGLGLTSVLTVDLDKGLFSVERDAVMAGAQDVYASRDRLVVASRRFVPGEPQGVAPSGGTTEVHMFDGGDEPATEYLGSGSVPGFVLNQFSMSEHEGALRVATTEEAPWTPTAPGTSESGVSVLRAEGGALRTVGRVTGLGKGERIYAVRFLGDRGYVVTFRQVDPLYSLDLRDPTAPKVTGELKITGYSAYLHPISDSLLLGVGQDATEQGRRLGPQVQLFDVGDPAAPKLLHRASLGGSGTAGAEQDHHAFLWWAPASLAVLPVDTYDHAEDGTFNGFNGAIGFRVRREGIGEVARITHPRPSEDRLSPPIGRSVVIGDRVLTLSATGIATNALADLAPLAFTPLG